MINFWVLFKSLGVTIGSAITFSTNSAIAQITQDGTLPVNSLVTKQGNITIIKDGTESGNNLFHSFKEFSVHNGSTTEFQYVGNIDNIINRVTGKSISNIDGILKVNGTANLFLINPNGIIFGHNAFLDIRGSFVASTASSVNFADGIKFSATNPQTIPSLKVSVPIGLQFGASAAPIRNQSQTKVNGATNSFGQSVGLQVLPGKTLALIGGDITLQGGNITASGGRIELGSVGANSLVTLNSTNQGWTTGYERVQNFQNIQLIERMVNGSNIPSIVDASGESGGNIQVQGRTVELIGYLVSLTTQTRGEGKGGDLTINAKKLIVRDGAQVFTSTLGKGNGGNLTVNASESVEVVGGVPIPNSNFFQRSALFSTTGLSGKAGDLTINTGRLRVEDGARITTESNGTEINSKLIPATGAGGDLTVKASESVELIGTSVTGSASGLFAATNGSGDAGKVIIDTKELLVQDHAGVSVSSKFIPGFTYTEDTSNLGKAGDLNVSARFILLDNQGKLKSDSDSGRGGNITLNVQDLLLMRHQSQISTNAVTNGLAGSGGNIFINAANGFIVAAPLENSDITANAFSGSGGKITINAKSIFGFVPRTRTDLVRVLQTQDPKNLNPSNLLTSDITAFSQQNPSLSGTIQINSPDVDPSKGLVELPVNVVDASQQIVTACNAEGKMTRASFIITGRGGIASNPVELLTADTVLADWITLEPEDENRANSSQNRVIIQESNTQVASQKVNAVNKATQIVEAQGWVMDANGNVVLVAQAPTVTPHRQALNFTSCAVVQEVRRNDDFVFN
ncbi:filamentous hemagglutinin N-terminal domain-containing protein [Nostoc sp. UHCC 0302]|uniref:two-partner secretion domain-containing protein n=1 Tax=Nostoc sp. UHCC 0302 TaxID=3134896 RepID=UPI00311C8D6A